MVAHVPCTSSSWLKAPTNSHLPARQTGARPCRLFAQRLGLVVPSRKKMAKRLFLSCLTKLRAVKAQLLSFVKDCFTASRRLLQLGCCWRLQSRLPTPAGMMWFGEATNCRWKKALLSLARPSSTATSCANGRRNACRSKMCLCSRTCNSQSAEGIPPRRTGTPARRHYSCSALPADASQRSKNRGGKAKCFREAAAAWDICNKKNGATVFLGCKVGGCSTQEWHVEPGACGMADFARRQTQRQPNATGWAVGETCCGSWQSRHRPKRGRRKPDGFRIGRLQSRQGRHVGGVAGTLVGSRGPAPEVLPCPGQ